MHILSDGLGDLGFERVVGVHLRSKVAEYWYARQGDGFLTHLICLSRYSRPRARLFVDLYVSSLPMGALGTTPLRHSILGQNLFQFQFYKRGRRVDEILPQEITFGGPDDFAELSKRLLAELLSLEGDIWQFLSAAARAECPSWFGESANPN